MSTLTPEQCSALAECYTILRRAGQRARAAAAEQNDAGSSTPSEPASHREVQRGDDTRNDSR
jgi:hypothetical protein